MDCPACGGRGCPACRDGKIDIPCCPLELITQDDWDVIELAGLYKKGLPPVAGGSLDQAAGFLAAARFIWSEEAVHKKQLGID